MKSSSNKNFNEGDIRPKEFISGQSIAMTIDIGRLLQHADRFVSVSCPACQSNKSRIRYRKYSLVFEECADCKTIYTNPRPTDKILEEFYKNSTNYEYWNKFIFPASEAARRERIFVPRVDKTLEFCQKYNVQTNSILEIGAAFGTFCLEMKSRNIFKKIIAIEPTPSLAETLRQKGLEVIQDVIENVAFADDEKFDVVVNFEVIEHIFSPKNFIENCHKLLKPGGVLIITCPNGQGFDFDVLGEKCNSLDHEHLNYFNPKSLSILLENSGFEVMETITPGKLDAELVRNKIVSGEFDVSTQPFLNKILIEQWEEVGGAFQRFLADNLLSSNLWAVAKAR